MPASYWLILGIVLLIGEVLTTDFSLTCFGLACFVAGFLSWLGLNIYWQFGVGALVIFILLFSLRPLFLRYLHKGTAQLKTNVDGLIGKTATILEVKEEDEKKGTVKLDGDFWTVQTTAPLKKGDSVVVEKIEGTTLFAKKGE